MGTARWVKTIAELQAETGMVNGEVTIVDGYFTAGDGGGGLLYFDDTGTGVPASATVTGATNASPIVITTSSAHALVSGQQVMIAGVGGNTAANGTWTITVISATQFQLQGSSGNANYTSGGIVGNGGTTVPSTAIQKFWRRLHSGEINVKWFGAKSDGTTANQASIQAIVTELTASGGVIYFPPGTFGISANIRVSSVSSLVIRGAGRELSIIKDLRTDAPVDSCVGIDCGILSFLSSPKCEVKDITIEGAAGFGTTVSPKRKGIYATGCSFFSVRNVVVRKAQAEAIYADGGERVRFMGNYVTDCATHGIFLNGSLSTDAGCHVTDNIVEKTSGAPIIVRAHVAVIARNLIRQPAPQGAPGIAISDADTFVLADNVINGSDFSLAATSPIIITNTTPTSPRYGIVRGNVVCRNVTVNVNSGAPILISNVPGEILVDGNLITENGRSSDGPSPGIELSGGAIGRVVVVNNQISKGSANNQDKGIRITSSVPSSNKIRIGINFISAVTPFEFQTVPSSLIGVT